MRYSLIKRDYAASISPQNVTTSPNALDASNRTLLVLSIVSVTCIAFLGVLHVFDPLSGDQALFLVGAERLHSGGVLYKDFWDLKQPGIYVLYCVAGVLFGFSQIGVHVADVCWQVIFAVAVICGLRRGLRDARWAAFAAVAIPGSYLAGSAPWHLVQTEELAGLPLFLMVWAGLESLADKKHWRWLQLLCGIAAGVALVFKLMFAIIIAAIALTLALVVLRERGFLEVKRAGFAWSVGLALPLLAVGIYALYHGIVTELFRTSIMLPLEINATVPQAPWARFVDGIMRYVLYFRGLIALAVFGIFLRSDGRTKSWRIIGSVWWIAALLTIVLQRQSWWQYQFLLLVPPTGMLATFGVSELSHRVFAKGRFRIAWLGLCGVVSYVAVPLPQQALDLFHRVIELKPYSSEYALSRYRSSISPEFLQARRDATALHASVSDGKIYVLGNPLIYLESHTLQAVAVNGWAPHLYTPDIWEKWRFELRMTIPKHVFVLNEFAYALPAWSPSGAAFMRCAYVNDTKTADGEWLKPRVLPHSILGEDSALRHQLII